MFSGIFHSSLIMNFIFFPPQIFSVVWLQMSCCFDIFHSSLIANFISPPPDIFHSSLIANVMLLWYFYSFFFDCKVHVFQTFSLVWLQIFFFFSNIYFYPPYVLVVLWLQMSCCSDMFHSSLFDLVLGHHFLKINLRLVFIKT